MNAVVLAVARTHYKTLKALLDQACGSTIGKVGVLTPRRALCLHNHHERRTRDPSFIEYESTLQQMLERTSQCRIALSSENHLMLTVGEPIEIELIDTAIHANYNVYWRYALRTQKSCHALADVYICVKTLNDTPPWEIMYKYETIEFSQLCQSMVQGNSMMFDGPLKTTCRFGFHAGIERKMSHKSIAPEDLQRMTQLPIHKVDGTSMWTVDLPPGTVCTYANGQSPSGNARYQIKLYDLMTDKVYFYLWIDRELEFMVAYDPTTAMPISAAVVTTTSAVPARGPADTKGSSTEHENKTTRSARAPAKSVTNAAAASQPARFQAATFKN